MFLHVFGITHLLQLLMGLFQVIIDVFMVARGVGVVLERVREMGRRELETAKEKGGSTR